MESVTSGHPDKICDQISDAVLDECLRQDPKSRVAVESFGSHGVLMLGGEVTTRAEVDFAEVARRIYRNIGHKKDLHIITKVVTQSPDIAQGVDTGGAGDQGIMYGFATDETPEFLPLAVIKVHALAKGLEKLRRTDGNFSWLKPDGKTQITLRNGKIKTVLVSCQLRPSAGQARQGLFNIGNTQFQVDNTFGMNGNAVPRLYSPKRGQEAKAASFLKRAENSQKPPEEKAPPLPPPNAINPVGGHSPHRQNTEIEEENRGDEKVVDEYNILWFGIKITGCLNPLIFSFPITLTQKRIFPPRYAEDKTHYGKEQSHHLLTVPVYQPHWRLNSTESYCSLFIKYNASPKMPIGAGRAKIQTMRTLRILLIFVFITGAAFSIAWIFSTKKFSQSARTPKITLAQHNPELAVSANKLEQGDTLVFGISNINTPYITATFNSKPAPLFSFRNTLIGIIGIDAKAETGASALIIKLPSGEHFLRDIIVEPRAFPVVKLILPPQLIEKGVTPEKLTSSITKKDKPALDAVFKIFTPEIYFNGPFEKPLKEWTDVGRFGAIRESPSGGIRHLGVDLKGGLGEKVAAANDGVVRFAGELKNFGKTVAVDHGMGIFSAYLHLSKIKVQKDERVKKGEIVGLVGSSGEYSIEPHLHFSIKIRGSSVDPRRFLDTVNKFMQ